MLIRAYRLLKENPDPSEEEIRLGYLRQSLPLHGLPEHRQGDPLGRGRAGASARRPRNDRETISREQREAGLKGIGCKRRRIEDARFIRGKGNYVDDLKLPGMLFGDFVRSPYAHARITSIDARPQHYPA